MKWLILGITGLLWSHVSSQPQPTQTYPFSKRLSSNFDLYWNFDATGITFEIIARTTGWVGLGISPTGSMAGSDIFTAGVTQDGRKYIQDRFAIDRVRPAVDTKQNVVLDEAIESGGYTQVRTGRRRWTTDNEDNVIDSGLVHVVWAYGASDPQDSNLDQIQKHVSSGTMQIELIPPPPLRNSVFLDNPRYLLLWDHDDVSIEFEIQVQTTGWAGLGISPSRDDNNVMTNADICMGWVANGRAHYRDSYALGYHEAPKQDDVNNIDLLYSAENSTHVKLRFRRDLASFDPEDRAIPSGLVTVIYAWGTNDDPTSYHGQNQRGSQRIQLITQAPPRSRSGSSNADWATPLGRFPPENRKRMSDDFYLFWDYDGRRVIFEIVARTRGWVAIGISDDRNMADSDIAVAWVDNRNDAHVSDRFAEAQVLPPEDTVSQDWTVLAGTEVDGVTKVAIARALTTQDPKDKPLKIGDNLIHWAWGPNKPGQGNDYITYHGENRRGTEVITISNSGTTGVQTQQQQSTDVSTIYGILGDVNRRLTCLEDASSGTCSRPAKGPPPRRP